MESEEPTPDLPDWTSIEMPDLRVVSIIHDADNDQFGLIYDEDLDPFHALGLLMVGMFRQLQDCTDSMDLEEIFDDPDDDA